jgi:Tfp pilus assembly protein PilX
MQRKQSNNESGIALVITLLLMLLVLSLVSGFIVLIMSGQQLTGLSNGQTRAFYGAEAGMEKMTADLGTLFDSTYAPPAAALNTIAANPPVNLPGITYVATDGSLGYKLQYPKDSSGNPVATSQTVKSGAYNGMTGLITPYTLTVTARTSSGAEVMLRRTTQTVGIPAFQFGVFCGKDCGFHAGPDFNFGGRVHTNGNLWLAEGSGNTLTISDKVTAFGEVVRTNIMNGLPLATGGWTGTVNITQAAGGTPTRSLAQSEGSITSLAGTPATSPLNPNWSTISLTNYNSYLINHATGVNKKLKLPIEILTNGQSFPVDILRRPTQGEGANPALLGERYFAQASVKILLSDNVNDIMLLPCIDATTQPIDLSTLAVDNSALANSPMPTWAKAPWYNPPVKIPMATSAATVAATPKTVVVNGQTITIPTPTAGYTVAPNGYWVPKAYPIMTGFLKVEIQIGYMPPCGKWQDVTQEILLQGFSGRNLNSAALNNYPNVPPLPGPQVEILPSGCADPSPNAIIRLERVRDNPNPISAFSPGAVINNCGFDTKLNPGSPTIDPTNYWPNVLFDTRQGAIRDVCPNGSNPCNFAQVMASGVTHYVELDVKNLARWLTGQIGTKGPGAYDPLNAPYNYVLYFSDRRGNYVPAGGITAAWPPVSPSTNETGEYGFSDFLNPANPSSGCPNGLLDQGEDDGDQADLTPPAPGIFYNYGQTPSFYVADPNKGMLFTDALAKATVPNPNCATPATVWPGYFIKNTQEARMNPPLFFRRALKLVNGSNINGPLSAKACPGSVACGLSIVSENPVYVQGDYNANSAGGGFNDSHVASAVLADSFTFLSNSWNDVNSFSSPYDPGSRAANFNGVTNGWYRVAVLAGKGPGFPWVTGTNNDFGSDGGVHNFLRYIESWGGETLNYRGSIVSMFYNRQAVGVYKCCNTVYSPPTRAYNFDTEFLDPSKLPPRTPMFRDINTTGFTQIMYPDQQ